LPAAQLRQQQELQQAEEKRLTTLKMEQARYGAECQQRELATKEENQKLDTLIQGLVYGVEDAIQEYVSIMLGNSAYPESFSVEHDFTFDSSLSELALTVLVPAPQIIPSVKEYKYAKAKDEITTTSLTLKDQKDRYLNAVTQVALRSLHEIFESDHAGRIATITLTVACEAVNAATGLQQRTPMVGVATDRTTFTSSDLSNVVPLATLKHLGALVSTNPYDLIPIDTSKGVRGK
jgi:restriction system protein